jgi:predicted phosphodiesterase
MASFKMIDILKPVDYNENPDRYKKVSIIVVSDTHKHHESLSIPDGDIFLHCGDFTNRHDWQNLSSGEIPQAIIDFNQWLGKLPHKHKLVICGNHEIGFGKLSQEEIQSNYLTNCKYLKDELIQIEGISIYGCSWLFSEHYGPKWSSIPSYIDILMTHIPPEFILDLAYQPKKSPSIEPCSMCNNTVHGCYGHWGSKSLIKEIRQRIQPRVHCFGHVHDDPGYKYDQDDTGTLFINAATDLSNQSFKFIFYADLHK